jgi:Xaa-Pro aminopeptidase
VSGGAPDTYGELGIRHEDTVVVTAEGCENLAPKWSGSPEEPAVV